MKFIAAVVAGMLTMSPAIADETGPSDILGNTVAELGFMAQCAASEISLSHLRLQTAASIIALSAPTPNPALLNLAESYRMMAKDGQERVKVYTDVMESTIIPEASAVHGLKKEAVLAQINQLLTRSIGDILANFANPMWSFEDQTKMQQVLMQESRSCETLAEKIIQQHTL